MSNRRNRARSSFDDPNGFDASYRIGSAAADLWSQAFEAKAAQGGYQSVVRAPHKRKALQLGLAARYRKGRARFQDPGPPAYEPQAQNMPPRRRVRRGVGAKRRRLSRGRYRKRRFGRGARRRTGSYGVKRRFKRSARRAGRRMSKSVGGVFARAFRNVLTRPCELTSETFAVVNNVGDNLQGKCSWYCFAPGWRPNYVDTNLAVHENVAFGTAQRTVDILLAKCETWFQFKNMGNQRCDVTMYKLYPKRDLRPPMKNILGVSNAVGGTCDLIASGFADASLAAYPGSAFRLPDWNEHGCDIFMNTVIPDFFHVKKAMRKFLEPGQFVVLKRSDKRERKRGYGDYGLNAGTALQTQFYHIKEFGELWLFRVQGSNMHQNTIVPPLVDTSTNPTMGGYNVEFYQRTKTTTYGAVGTAPKEIVGMASARLPTYPLAQENGWEMRVAQGDPMNVN